MRWLLPTAAFWFFILPSVSHAQTSFLRSVRPAGAANVPLQTLNLATAPNGEISMATVSSSANLQLVTLSPTGNILQAQSVTTANSLTWRSTSAYERNATHHVVVARGNFSINNMTAIFGLNFNNGAHWARRTTDNAGGSPAIALTPDGRAVVSSTFHVPAADKLGLSALQLSDGTPVWDRLFRRTDEPNIQAYSAEDIKAFPNGDLSVMGIGTRFDNKRLKFLLKLGANGNILRSVAISNDSVQLTGQSIDAAGNVFLAGRVLLSSASPFPGVFGTYDGFVAKLDNNYNLLWCKRLVTLRFPNVDTRIRVLNSGEVAFSTRSVGIFSLIGGRLSAEGEVLQSRGYAVLIPQMAFGANGAFYFSSSGSSAGVLLEPILAKADLNGTLGDCRTFDACPVPTNMPLVFSNWAWSAESMPSLPALPVTTGPVEFGSEPYCQVPEPPSPYFILPDTVCQAACLSPQDLRNQGATYSEWRLKGPGLDTALIDEPTFSYCFDVPGQYLISQTVWLFGCALTQEHTLTVLADNLRPPLGPDRSLCDAPPYYLLPESNRPLRTFVWSDGSALPYLRIDSSGLYALTASDGYCSVTDEVALVFVEQLLAAPPLTLPPDTTVCPSALPFILRPQSDYTDQFWVNSTISPAAEFKLAADDLYTVTAIVAGCPFKRSMRLRLQSCEVPVYMPTAFSPNYDGINDSYEVDGAEMTPLALAIYDRWGGLCYRAEAAPFSWDGRRNGQPAQAGAYLVVFSYRNLRTGQEETIRQEVLLLR